MKNFTRSGILAGSVALLLTVYTVGALALAMADPQPIKPAKSYSGTIQRRVPTVSAPKLNTADRERICLAKNIYFEARNQSKRGQIAVALVTLNRVNSPDFPDDVCGVVWQSKVVRGRRIGQFSWTQDGKSDYPMNHKVWVASYNLAGRLLHQAKSKGVMDFTNGALFYHADYIKPKWSSEMQLVAKIDAHKFYKPL